MFHEKGNPLVSGGCGRCSADLINSAIAMALCGLFCVLFVGCSVSHQRTDEDRPAEVMTEKEAARILRKQFQGL